MDGSHLNWSEDDWRRLGEAVYASRSAQGFTQVDLASRAEVSRSSLQKIEQGFAVRMGAVHAVARVLDWPGDHAEKVLAGRTEGRPASSSPAKAEVPMDLPLAIAHELKAGPLIDSQVVELGEDSGARMIVVLRGKEDMTPEEIENALTEWKRVARQMRMRGTRGG